tara:strand:- start:173 stop:292 length:120 start_codon:yes stop_codon:yes gene_type:complete
MAVVINERAKLLAAQDMYPGVLPYRAFWWLMRMFDPLRK